MTRMFFLILFLFIAQSTVIAQQEKFKWYASNFEIGISYPTYGNDINLRQEPNIESDTVATLAINEQVEILEKVDQFHVVYGMNSQWVKVKTGSGIGGYLVSAFLAFDALKFADGSTLVYNKRYKEKNKPIQVQLRRVSSKGFSELGSYTAVNSDFEVHIMDGKGLQNVDHVINVNFIADSCGETGGKLYLALDLNSDQVVHLGTFENGADGGVYHFHEELVFPSDPQGMEGMLIYEGEEGEENPDNGEYRTVSKRKIYNWSEVESGKKIVPFTYD